MRPIKIISLSEMHSAVWGKQGEQNAVFLSYDLTGWSNAWPNGAPAVAFERADGLKYAHDYLHEGNTLLIPVSRADTEKAGVCKLTISWIYAANEARSVIICGSVLPSIVSIGEKPTDPQLGIIEQVNAAAVRAEKAAERAEAAGGSGGGGSSGGGSTGGGVDFVTDETLSLKNGVLSVNTTDAIEPGNDLPVTSSAVYNTVGNIETLLSTI